MPMKCHRSRDQGNENTANFPNTASMSCGIRCARPERVTTAIWCPGQRHHSSREAEDFPGTHGYVLRIDREDTRGRTHHRFRDNVQWSRRRRQNPVGGNARASPQRYDVTGRSVRCPRHQRDREPCRRIRGSVLPFTVMQSSSRTANLSRSPEAVFEPMMIGTP